MPPDAIAGWDDEHNAEHYDAFTRSYPFYTDTSHDLATRADLANRYRAVDLCGGTGATATVLLQHMPSDSHVISVDAAKAMQTVGQRSRPNPRITWITARAENLSDHVWEPVEAVVCNSAIWKTDVSTVFAAVKRVLGRGGRFVFNIGGAFAGLRPPGPDRSSPSLSDVITAVAVADYGYVPQPDNPRPKLTAATITVQLATAGFSVLSCECVTRAGTMEEKRAWLSIPVFARPPGQLTHAQRMRILKRAYAHIDPDQPVRTSWLIITAQA